MGMVGNLVGGVVSERLVERHGRKRTVPLGDRRSAWS